MKNLLRIAYYLQTGLPTLFWVTWLGVGFIAVGALLALSEPAGAFTLMLFGFVIGLALPFLAAAYEFRLLIANRRLGLVPGLRLHAGIAMLFLTLFVSTLPFAAALLLPRPVDSKFPLLAFTFASTCVLCIQWLATSRVAIWVPWLFIALVQFPPLKQWGSGISGWLMFDGAASLALFGISCVIWVVSLHRLSVRRSFRQPFNRFRSPVGNESRSDRAFPNSPARRAAQEMTPERNDSPASALLLGTADRFWARFFRPAIVVLAGTLPVYILLFGFGKGMGWPRIVDGFAWYCVPMAMACCLSKGEIAARGRLIWLRHGSGRSRQWRVIETTALIDILPIALLLVALPIVASALASASDLRITEHILAGTSGCLLATYFGLAGRIHRLSTFSMGAILGGFMGLFGFLFVRSNFPDPLIALGVLGVALLFRHVASKGFRTIDWHLVHPRQGVRM